MGYNRQLRQGYARSYTLRLRQIRPHHRRRQRMSLRLHPQLNHHHRLRLPQNLRLHHLRRLNLHRRRLNLHRRRHHLQHQHHRCLHHNPFLPLLFHLLCLRAIYLPRHLRPRLHPHLQMHLPRYHRRLLSFNRLRDIGETHMEYFALIT
ncbi:hypothetical protein FKP32DRAFT_1456191 [Trametes sanguinea]|nr:hypothetical protein FKP32DRAFT_1456191 [Trametes sanguinea]